MHIKDLATKVELGTEMAEVRGGARNKIGNIKIKEVYAYNDSFIQNGNVNANTNVNANDSAGSTLRDIGAVVTYAPVNTVTQTSGNAFDITSMFDRFNVS